MKPVALTVLVDNIPEVLRVESRWVNWRYEWDGERWMKPPYQPRGVSAKPNDPTTWSTFDAAVAARHSFDGIGFMLGDGWAGIDLDDCWPDVADAKGILDRLATCYLEISPSGAGSKAIGRSQRVGGQIAFAVTPPAFTTSVSPRFFTITGRGTGNPLADLSPFINDWFPPAPAPQRHVTAGASRPPRPTTTC